MLVPRYRRHQNQTPGTPHPQRSGTFLAPGGSPPSDPPVIPSPYVPPPIQQVVHTTVSAVRHQVRPVVPIVEDSSSPVEAVNPRVVELHCLYPKQIFLSAILPTRSKREFLEFKSHCREAWQSCNNQAFVIYRHPLTELDEFSTGPLNFVSYLWKARVVLANHSITEEYSFIRQSAQ